MIKIPKLFTQNKKSEKNRLTNQAQFIEQGEMEIPQRAATATKELEAQVLNSNTNNDNKAAHQVSNREAIIAKSRQLTEHRMEESAPTGSTKEYRSPLMATALEQPSLETVNQSTVPLIEVNNPSDETMDSEIMNRDYITNDEILYTQSHSQHTQNNVVPNDPGNDADVVYPVHEIGEGGGNNPGKLDIDEEAEIAEIIAQWEEDPYADASDTGNEAIGKLTTVKVIYDNAEFIETATFQFNMPLSIFIDAYEMEIASQGYFSAKDINGTYVTVNPNKCFTIEIF